MLANLHHISPARYYSVEADTACRTMATHASPATENFCGISHVHHDINTVTEEHIIAMGTISLVTMGTPCHRSCLSPKSERQHARAQRGEKFRFRRGGSRQIVWDEKYAKGLRVRARGFTYRERGPVQS